MAIEQRFLTAFLEEETDVAGLVKELDGSVWLIDADGARTQLPGTTGPPGPPGPAGGFTLPLAADVRYVAGTGGGITGSDSNDGNDPSSPLATLQHAYSTVPTSGGGICMLSGRHDVGPGFVQNVNHKCAVFYTLDGMPSENDTDPDVVVYSSQDAEYLFTLGSQGSIQNGWGFRGVAFDVTNPSSLGAILTEDLNNLRMYNNIGIGDDHGECYLVRSTHPLFDDTSWYRLRDNWCHNVGLCSLADDETDGNCNQHEIVGNVVFPGGNSWGVRMGNAQRCWIGPNNIEGGGPGGISMEAQSKYNYILGNAGEGALSPYVKFGSSARDNVFFNYGSSSSAVLVLDQNGNNHQLRTQTQTVTDKTTSWTLASVNEAGSVFKANSPSGAITCTIPLESLMPWGIGKGFQILQEGGFKVTVTGAVTIRGLNGFRTAGQFAMVNVLKIGSDEWLVWGDTIV